MQEVMQIGVYGAGGFGREVSWLLEDLPYRQIAFIDDAVYGELRGQPVLSWNRFCRVFLPSMVTIAVGDPKVREALAERVALVRARCPTLIHPSVRMSRSVEVGPGAILCAGNILTVDIRLGAYVHVNLGCTIGHDVVIEDFATLAPGVHVSGNVHIGRGAYIGTGACIINGEPGKPIVIGSGAVVGAGACVTADVLPDCLYAGVPAVLKKRYAQSGGLEHRHTHGVVGKIHS